ncbi:pyridoxal phosphate-dependent aminotransferase [Candidatus Gottesmanbacteria bacterium]|nr:pyridoxal phosphate-dependent aminotransferase [Candidatus Gottesmanbacteria bacterium]
MGRLTISQRAQNTPASAIRKLTPLADRAKKRGIKIYHLNIGQPDLPTPPSITRYIRNFDRQTLEYAPSQGMKEAVYAWQKFYHNKGIDLDLDDIIVTSGGSEGLLFVFFSICDPGDELLLLEPFYTSYAIIAGMGNIKIKPIKTEVETGYHLPKRELIEKAITKKTKAILLCNPNNPTGTLYTKSETQTLVEIALKHNLFIISDETYQEIVFDNQKVTPFFSFKKIRDRLIICDSVSKRFNSCGARVGSVVSKNKDVMSAILRFGQGRLSVATMEQLAVCEILRDHKAYTEKIKKIYQKRRDVVVSELKKIPGVSFQIPEGAFYIMPKIPVSDSDDFAKFLLNDFSNRHETVMIAPASGFYSSAKLGKDEIRIAYVLEEKKLKRAIELLGMGIEEYRKRERINELKN